MRHMFRPRLSYANVMSTLAVFIALGGSSYAAVTLSGSSIRHRSIPGAKLKRNTVTGLEVRESRLGRVPRAAIADRVGGFTGDELEELKVRCPLDTFPVAGTCIEKTARPPASYGVAVLECASTDRVSTPGRRLPTHGELQIALSAVTLTPGGELTSNVYPSGTSAGELDVLYVTDQVGGVALTPNTGAGGKAFRCATDPIN